MIESKIEFYHSKGKLFLGIIFSLLLVAFGTLMVYVAYIGESILFFILALFIIVLFSFFSVANILKMNRGYPYITITEEYIQLDSFTKSEVTIYFTDIEYIKVSEASYQKIIEIDLYDENDYFAQLSFHNKLRLFMNRVTGFSLFTISPKSVRKQERSNLLKTLDYIIQQKLNNEAPMIETAQKQNEKLDFMEKYDPTPQVNRSINRSYFLKSYSYGFIIFALSFILFYLLISKNDDYLFYIIVSFIFYPFAKVLIDLLVGFKLRHRLDKQKGVTYYFEQLIFMFDLFLFHVSLFIAPIGILFLLIRFIVIRIKR
ncbi:STM3941 family protein [Oceanobacillus saliphilus]|uniref:STM3941 family protein n=1 Tax=Oceanobacillus saliphilus TaxID=2925834 RepID=UPI00201D865B|nr:STM3941 family protein [Oceanobacillus saliphilus]